MPLKRAKDKVVNYAAKALRRQSFFEPVRHSKLITSVLRDRLKSGKPLSPAAKKLLLDSATGPAVYTTAAAAGAVGLKKSMDKKASAFRSFYDELNKIASLE